MISDATLFQRADTIEPGWTVVQRGAELAMVAAARLTGAMV